jgi:hypothetical protein
MRSAGGREGRVTEERQEKEKYGWRWWRRRSGSMQEEMGREVGNKYISMTCGATGTMTYEEYSFA